MANKLDISRDSGRLTISYSWRTSAMWFLLFFSVIWNLFIIGALVSGAGFFISIHLLVGIFIAWFTLSRFLNKTTIAVDRNKLLLEHGPIPWPFAKQQNIPARALVQLYVGKSSVKVNDQPTYNLMAKLDTGVEVKLIKAEQDRQLLQELETTIEAYLDIENDTSFDLSEGGFDKLDLEQMKASLEKMDKLKKWMPAAMVSKMELMEEKMLAEVGRRTNEEGSSAPTTSTAPASAPRSRSSAGSAQPRDNDFFRSSPTGARPLPEPEHDFVFPMYRAAEGSKVRFLNESYTVGRSAQIDFQDDSIDFGRQFELRPNDGSKARYFYTQHERGRWSYFQERRLDDDEVAALDFTGNLHPSRFENGSDRYYPRDEQTGTRFMGQHGEAIRQFIYFTTASSTQFRALQPAGRGWEVYVMEVVDGGDFDEG
ncbi:hypothetical protein [Neolewinella agarilytica]|uniref:hypothetical protein n=1 Tax=Neolewinella agarilytica TaxID=478744 RepID=UPI002353BDCB|nr:hypothetical protein [Neolewinella agarilytica]